MTAPFNEDRTPNPTVVNDFHRHSDVDDSEDSQHHTLGTNNNQASPGNHSHNGSDSPVLVGYVRGGAGHRILVTGSQSSGEALSNLLFALDAAGIIGNGTSP